MRPEAGEGLVREKNICPVVSLVATVHIIRYEGKGNGPCNYLGFYRAE